MTMGKGLMWLIWGGDMSANCTAVNVCGITGSRQPASVLELLFRFQKKHDFLRFLK